MVDLACNQDYGKPGNRFLQKIPAVDQRVKAMGMLFEPHNDAGMQGTPFAHRQQSADQSRQAERSKRRKQRRTQRDGADHCSVCINGTAEPKRQKHRRAARKRGGQQQKRNTFPCPRTPEQRQRKQQKGADLNERRPEQRNIKQRKQCIHGAEQRNAERGQNTQPHAHPCRREQINAAVHQRIVNQERFDRDFHATRITITVMSSDPPRVCASSRSASPVVPPACSAARIVFSIPSVSTSCTPSEQSTIRSFR